MANWTSAIMAAMVLGIAGTLGCAPRAVPDVERDRPALRDEAVSTTRPAATQPVFDPKHAQEMGVVYRPLPDNGMGFLIGYLGDGVFFQWRGVVLPVDWVIRGLRSPGILRHALPTVLIDPPLDYVRLEGDICEVGYYDNMWHRFLRWKGVRCRIASIPKDRIGRERWPKSISMDESDFVIDDIPVPAHLRPLAEQMNRSIKQSH